jgi:oligopeptide transport system ATP-binding protein
LKAVDDISFDIMQDEILGLVGESGSGKTTLGRLISNIYELTDGYILYKGKNIAQFSKEEKKLYTKDVQVIFQDPYSSLDPRMTVSEIIAEGMIIHHMYSSQKEIKEKTNELLRLVGLNKEHSNRFPHEFSGGQRQRIGIARALALNPKFLVCDEPISALDVSIQAQIVNLFKKIKSEMRLTYLFIAHDLSMVKYISDRVAVMYLGKIVEIAPSSILYKEAVHPYTEFLLSAIPIPDPKIESRRPNIRLEGEIPSPINLPKGCSFQGRCKYKDESCATKNMTLIEVSNNHWASCSKAGR